ncbi:hypothetical protein cgR_6048 [Corynebacterium glutamicum R]|uniref:Uncharacterized protein n=1 Tax=Corynebacterium glutamicum (strain R) TaxID=340322 RepID=A0AB72VF17_CORGB|nr:hypothetical protein cgR_6048 [Corynebacterium glutamicum R]
MITPALFSAHAEVFRGIKAVDFVDFALLRTRGGISAGTWLCTRQ